MRFVDRIDAGRQLTQRLRNFAQRDNTVVLGVPRGGVPVAFEVAQALHAPLDLIISRKLGVPGNEELAFGAVAAGVGVYLDRQIIAYAGITDEQIASITARARRALEERSAKYRRGKPPVEIERKLVIVVDDGVATGASMSAAIHSIRQANPEQLIVAVPVAPVAACLVLERLTDMLVVLQTPDDFSSVSQFYSSFPQISDDEVIRLLRMNNDGMRGPTLSAPTEPSGRS